MTNVIQDIIDEIEIINVWVSSFNSNDFQNTGNDKYQNFKVPIQLDDLVDMGKQKLVNTLILKNLIEAAMRLEREYIGEKPARIFVNFSPDSYIYTSEVCIYYDQGYLDEQLASAKPLTSNVLEEKYMVFIPKHTQLFITYEDLRLSNEEDSPALSEVFWIEFDSK